MLKSFKHNLTYSNKQAPQMQRKDQYKPYESPNPYMKENKPQSYIRRYQDERPNDYKYQVPIQNSNYDPTTINSRLQEIRKKYENRLRKNNQNVQSITPLKDSKAGNISFQKYSNPDYKRDNQPKRQNEYKRQMGRSVNQFQYKQIKYPAQSKHKISQKDTGVIKRSFSFANQDRQFHFNSSANKEQEISNNKYNLKSSIVLKESYVGQKLSNSKVDIEIKSKQELEFKRSRLRSNNKNWAFQKETKYQPISNKDHSFTLDKSIIYDKIENTRPTSQYERTSQKPQMPKQDLRIQSIDKINSKIKQILSYMNQEKQAHLKEQSKSNYYQNQNKKSANLAVSSFTNVTESKIKQKNYDVKESRFQVPETAKETKPMTSYIKKNIDNSKPQYPIRKPFEHLQKRQFKNSQRPESVAPIHQIQQSRRQTSYTPNREYRLSSGKDLDEEIKKIQQKIQKSEDQKKRLNIKFDQIRTKRPGDSQLQSKYNSKFEKQRTEPLDLQSPMKRTVYTPPPKIVEKDQKFISPFKLIEVNIEKKNEQKIQEKKIEKKHENVNYNRPSSSYKSQFKIIPIPCQMDPEFKVETKKFIKCLQKQVQLDEQFRNRKIWFEGIGKGEQKWNALRQQLEKEGLFFDIKQIKNIFQCTQQQHNPFHNVGDAEESYSLVVKKYIDSQQYWRTNMSNKFDSKELADQNFKAEILDLERKGFLSVEDFVRFLNIETGTFYRNRDLILFFRRLTKDVKVSFEQFIEVIGNTK